MYNHNMLLFITDWMTEVSGDGKVQIGNVVGSFIICIWL